MHTTIAYIRVSTGSQDLATQRDRVKAAGATKVFEEKVSGAKKGRTQLEAALEFVREGDTFVCTKADRIARSTSELLRVVDLLTEKKVKLKVLDQPELSNSGPTARLLLEVLGAVASFERSLIVSRTAEGREKAKKKGVKYGRTPKLNPQTLNLLKRLRTDEKLSLEAIAVRTGLSMSTVQRGLRH